MEKVYTEEEIAQMEKEYYGVIENDLPEYEKEMEQVKYNVKSYHREHKRSAVSRFLLKKYAKGV